MKKIDISTKTHENVSALVDDEDYERINSMGKWSAYKGGRRTLYAGRQERVDGRTKCFLMHREVLHTEAGLSTDHINGDGLDNRKSNLRQCTHKQNLMNRRVCKRSLSGYKGVSTIKGGLKWQVRIGSPPNRVNIGTFTCPTEGARAYDEVAKKLYGEFAWLNFP